MPAVSIFGSLLHILCRFPVQNTSQHISDYDILTGKLPGSPEVYEATPTTLFHKCVLCYSSHGKIPSLHSGLVSHISGIAVHGFLIFPQLFCTKGILPHDLPFHKKGRSKARKYPTPFLTIFLLVFLCFFHTLYYILHSFFYYIFL